jgi:hypothetical protein
LATFLTSLFVILFNSGETPVYWISRNLEITILTRAILTVLMNLSALIFYYLSGSDRSAVTRYSKYLVAIYSLIAVSIGLELTNNFLSVNIGTPRTPPATLIPPSLRNLRSGYRGAHPFRLLRPDHLPDSEEGLPVLVHRC